MFRRDGRRADPRWEVAASTHIFSADRTTVVQLVRDVDPMASQHDLDGVLVARSHPTGWFVCAVRRDDLQGEELGHFNELVTVRTYLLLRHGPVQQVWTPTTGDREWRSAASSVTAGSAGIVGDLWG